MLNCLTSTLYSSLYIHTRYTIIPNITTYWLGHKITTCTNIWTYGQKCHLNGIDNLSARKGDSELTYRKLTLINQPGRSEAPNSYCLLQFTDRRTSTLTLQVYWITSLQRTACLYQCSWTFWTSVPYYVKGWDLQMHHRMITIARKSQQMYLQMSTWTGSLITSANMLRRIRLIIHKTMYTTTGAHLL
jgi:hypothetical protein